MFAGIKGQALFYKTEIFPLGLIFNAAFLTYFQYETLLTEYWGDERQQT